MLAWPLPLAAGSGSQEGHMVTEEDGLECGGVAVGGCSGLI